jgi:hypothetical protein
MKERFINTAELTRSLAQPRLNIGVMNMPEPGAGEVAPSTGRVRLPEEALRAQWGRTTTGREVTPEERSTIEMFSREGIAPLSGGSGGAGERRPTDPPDLPGQNPDDPDSKPPFTDPRLKSIVARYKRSTPTDSRSAHDLIGQITNILNSSEGLDPADRTMADEAIADLHDWELAMRSRDRVTETGRYFNLNDADVDTLNRPGRAPFDWLDQQFDRLYENTKAGREFDSATVRSFENGFSEASRHLSYLRPEILEEFTTIFNTRFHLMQMRTSIGYRSMENIQKSSFQLGAHGILTGFSMENGQVASLYNRMNELIDDARIADPLNHINPDFVNHIIDKVLDDSGNPIEGQTQIVKANLSEFNTNEYKDKSIKEITDALRLKARDSGSKEDQDRFEKWSKITSQFRRAGRTAYDVFVTSQRLGVLVARGKAYPDLRSYFSDPASGPLAQYNWEELSLKKWNLRGPEDMEMLEHMKRNVAMEWINANKANLQDKGFSTDFTEEQIRDLGTRRIRDLFVAPDFLSSGWRIMGILGSLEERVIAKHEYEAKARKLGGTPTPEQVNSSPDLTPEEKEAARVSGKKAADNLALFFRLRYAEVNFKESEPKSETKEEVLGRIAKFRPEEIMRLYRERIYNDRLLSDRYNAVFQRPEFAELLATVDSPEKVYEAFKKKYGRVLREIRDESYLRYEAKDIGKDGFTPEEISKIEAEEGLGPGEAEKLRSMIAAMTDFAANPQTTKEIVNYHRFSDIYTRTINTDDGLLFDLENENLVDHIKLDSDGKPMVLQRNKFTSLSQKYSTDQGGDGYVRAWNDTAAGETVLKAFQKFVSTEEPEKRFEAAMEGAEASTGYLGFGGRARFIRHTIGAHLHLAKKDYFWEVVGLDRLPFRLPASDLQRIYGPGAHSMSRDEIRPYVDQIRKILTANVAHLTVEQEAKLNSLSSDAERTAMRKQIYEHNKHASERTYHDLERLLEITGKDFAKLRAFNVLIFLILAVFNEGLEQAQSFAGGSSGGGGKKGH